MFVAGEARIAGSEEKNILGIELYFLRSGSEEQHGSHVLAKHCKYT